MRMEKLLLASGSPRRAEILRAVGWPFEARAMDIDETPGVGESAAEMVERLALGKAVAAAKQYSQGLGHGADTKGVIDSEILGKPRDKADRRCRRRPLRG